MCRVNPVKPASETLDRRRTFLGDGEPSSSGSVCSPYSSGSAPASPSWVCSCSVPAAPLCLTGSFWASSIGTTLLGAPLRVWALLGSSLQLNSRSQGSFEKLVTFSPLLHVSYGMAGGWGANAMVHVGPWVGQHGTTLTEDLLAGAANSSLTPLLIASGCGPRLLCSQSPCPGSWLAWGGSLLGLLGD